MQGPPEKTRTETVRETKAWQSDDDHGGPPRGARGQDEARFGDGVDARAYRLRDYLRATRRCKLYDFERGAWTDYRGRVAHKPRESVGGTDWAARPPAEAGTAGG